MKKGNKDEEEDPIEKSLNERLKAGTITSVVAVDKKAVGSKPVTKISTTGSKLPAKEEKKEEKKSDKHPSTSIPAKMTIEKKPLKDDKNKEPKATLPGLNSAPKVMKGKKKNPDEEKKEDE